MPKAKQVNNESKQMNLPKINTKDMTPKIMVLALIVMAFVIGMLYQKVSDLQNGVTAVATGTTTGNQPTGTTPPAVNVGVGHLPLKGDPNAKVTVVEFADYRCPFCEQFFTQTEPLLFKDYVDTGKIKFAFRQYPFLPTSATNNSPIASTLAANASECANDQNKFWDMHDYLYKNQPPETDVSMYNVDTLTKAAGTLGLDTTKFRTCLTTQADNAKVQQDLSDAQAVGVTGTPMFFVNGVLINGAQPYSVFQQAINAALK